MRGITLPIVCATLTLCACESGDESEGGKVPTVEDGKASQAKTAEAGEDRLNQTAWVLAKLPGRELLDDTLVTLSFAEGQLSGTDGCNRFNTRYSMDGEALTIDPRMASTRMACTPPIEEQASAFIKSLGRTQSVKMDAAQLFLLDESGALLATLVAQQTQLSGTRWDVTRYNNGRGGVTTLIQGTALTLELAKDGRLSGSAGCNRFVGTYTVNGNRIQTSPAAATRRLCAEPEGVMEQEAAFLAALARSQVARFEGDLFELRSESGALMIAARRSPQSKQGKESGTDG